ncbi:MAG: thiol-disulfide oxidoreductase DCC family protein [Segniliparus sp.]|uniref:thiol-disulfide oxidoreductase DCC family protein n=1 Tax=Segniliparus sp. TaxID=2804064 RepID=UPI003F31D0C8
MSGELEVLFDADCGFCQRSVAVLKKLDRGGRLTFTALQTPGAPGRFGIGLDQAYEQLWALDRSGRRAGGAHAVASAADAALGTRVLGRALRVRPLGRVAERAYRWVAGHRYMLPGSTAACAVQPR